MANFKMGDKVALISDDSIEGAVIGIFQDQKETKYTVYTKNGDKTYYESQLEKIDLESKKDYVGFNTFNARITASLIRNPVVSSLYSLNSAKINIIPHQFRPVLKFINSDRPRLLIADGVGVGKTIEAGLILKELEARSNINSVLIICPRPLIAERKWELEMKRFDESFEPIDGDKFKFCLSQMDLEGEWPEKYSKAIIPFSLFDKNKVEGSDEYKRKTKALLEVDPPKFDLVIVDEAHHIRNTETYAYKAVETFVDNAEAVVFLTATPVQLEAEDLYTLLKLLRPDYVIDKNTFQQMSEPNVFINSASRIIRARGDNWQEEALENINKACNTAWGRKIFSDNPDVKDIISKLKSNEIRIEDTVKLITDVENMHTFSNVINRTRRRDIGRYTTRDSQTVEIQFTSAQKVLHDAILEIIHEMLSIIHMTENTMFMMTTIRRQVASCLFGLVPMLEELLRRHENELIFEFDEDYDSVDNSSILSDLEINTKINQIITLAKNLPEEDPKYDAMLQIIEKKQQSEKNKVMIFSSFRHTLNYLYKRLISDGYRVGLIHGGVKDSDRLELRERFDSSITDISSSNAIDIMLFSEVGTEGLDYQFCDCMINYDLPWNPMRIEQRIGRIDRNGQTSEKVNIYNLITPGTIDADIYDRCLLRVGVFKESIGDCEDILGGVTKEINKIATNFNMSDEERRAALQQMTDNRVRIIQEEEKLEEKQRELFGINIDSAEFDKKLDNAKNYWLSQDMIENLVEEFLNEILEKPAEYLLGEKDIKNLRLSQEARKVLLDDFKGRHYKKNKLVRAYEKYLKGEETFWKVTFSSEAGLEDMNLNLINTTHPMVRQAAEFLESNKKTICRIKVTTDEIKEGVYHFILYQWVIVSDKKDIEIRVLSENSDLDNAIFNFLKNCEDDNEEYEDPFDWKELEEKSHDIWKNEIEKNKAKTEERIKYREASLYTSTMARIAMLEDQKLNSNNSGEVYLRLTEGKINKAKNDYKFLYDELQEKKKKADIFSEVLCYGILRVKNSK